VGHWGPEVVRAARHVASVQGLLRAHLGHVPHPKLLGDRDQTGDDLEVDSARSRGEELACASSPTPSRHSRTGTRSCWSSRTCSCTAPAHEDATSRRTSAWLADLVRPAIVPSRPFGAVGAPYFAGEGPAPHC